MKSNLLILMVVFLFSCKKENCIDGDSQMPVIKMTTPTNTQSFTAGQPIPISASITDNQKIREIHLEIINTTTGAFITHEHFSPGKAEFLLSKTFTAQATSAYKIKIEAEDMHANKARTEATITSN
jgi:hypothetical protein